MSEPSPVSSYSICQCKMLCRNRLLTLKLSIVRISFWGVVFGLLCFFSDKFVNKHSKTEVTFCFIKQSLEYRE